MKAELIYLAQLHLLPSQWKKAPEIQLAHRTHLTLDQCECDLERPRDLFEFCLLTVTHGHCHLELAFAVIHKTVSRSVEAFISLVVCSVALWHSTVHTSSDSCHRHRVYMRFHYVKHTHTQLYVMFIRILGAPTANVSGSNFSPQSHPRVDFTTVTSGP